MARRAHSPKPGSPGCPADVSAAFARLARRARAAASPKPATSQPKPVPADAVARLERLAARARFADYQRRRNEPPPADVFELVEEARHIGDPLEPPAPVEIRDLAGLDAAVQQHGALRVKVRGDALTAGAQPVYDVYAGETPLSGRACALTERLFAGDTRRARTESQRRQELFAALRPAREEPEPAIAAAVEPVGEPAEGRMAQLLASMTALVASLARREQPAPLVHVYSPEPLPQPAPVVNVQLPEVVTMLAAPTRTIVTARDGSGLVESTETHPLGLPANRLPELEPGSS